MPRVNCCKSLASMPLAIKRGAQLSMAICTRSSTVVMRLLLCSFSTWSQVSGIMLQQACRPNRVVRFLDDVVFQYCARQPHLSTFHNHAMRRGAQAGSHVLLDQENCAARFVQHGNLIEDLLQRARIESH